MPCTVTTQFGLQRAAMSLFSPISWPYHVRLQLRDEFACLAPIQERPGEHPPPVLAAHVVDIDLGVSRRYAAGASP